MYAEKITRLISQRNYFMFDRLEILPPTLLAGLKRKIPLTSDFITALWRDFMQRVKSISHRKNSDLYSVQLYDADIKFETFNPATPVTKWAAIAVTDGMNLPTGIELCKINGGLYAVFLHKGIPAKFPETMSYIFQTWLPESGYEFDQREQFELMGEKYIHNDPLSEEEVWIPIRKK